jgi:hypothetical protein
MTRSGGAHVDILDHALDALPRWPAPQIRLFGSRRVLPPKRVAQEIELAVRDLADAFAPEALTESPSWAMRLTLHSGRYRAMMTQTRLPRDHAAKIIEILQTGIALLRKKDIY